MATPEELASDPQASGQDLYQLAIDRPDLRAAIAANPAAYAGLLDWLGGLGDPEVDAALAARGGEVPAEEAYAADPDSTAAVPAASVPAQEPVTTPAPVPTPAPMPVASPEAPVKSSSPIMKVLLGAVTVVALVAIGAVLWLVLGQSKDQAEADLIAQSQEEKQDTRKHEQSSEAEAAAKQKAEREKAELEKAEKENEAKEKQPSTLTSGDHGTSSTDGTVKYPAPPSSVAASYFVMPSGNIGCNMTSTGTTCTIYEYHFDVNNIGGCNNPRPLTIVLDANGPRLDCNVSSVAGGDGPPLLYNTSSAMGNYACHSTADGLTCWNTVTGSSFAVAKEGYVTGSSGEIAQSAFPWN